jgi:hypothetical protein
MTAERQHRIERLTARPPGTSRRGAADLTAARRGALVEEGYLLLPGALTPAFAARLAWPSAVRSLSPTPTIFCRESLRNDTL